MDHQDGRAAAGGATALAFPAKQALVVGLVVRVLEEGGQQLERFAMSTLAAWRAPGPMSSISDHFPPGISALPMCGPAASHSINRRVEFDGAAGRLFVFFGSSDNPPAATARYILSAANPRPQQKTRPQHLADHFGVVRAVFDLDLRPRLGPGELGDFPPDSSS